MDAIFNDRFERNVLTYLFKGEKKKKEKKKEEKRSAFSPDRSSSKKPTLYSERWSNACSSYAFFAYNTIIHTYVHRCISLRNIYPRVKLSRVGREGIISIMSESKLSRNQVYLNQASKLSKIFLFLKMFASLVKRWLKNHSFETETSEAENKSTELFVLLYSFILVSFFFLFLFFFFFIKNFKIRSTQRGVTIDVITYSRSLYIRSF